MSETRVNTRDVKIISRNQICQFKMCHIFCGPERDYLHDAPGVSASVCTCVLALCISVTLPAVEGICRFSGPVWAGSRQWRCRSSAEPIGKLRRSAGIVRLAWDVWPPCRRQRGCYSIRSRSRIHLAVKKTKQISTLDLLCTYMWDFLCFNTDVFQKARSDLAEMRFFRVKLFLQVSDKAQLESVNVFDISKDHFQLIVVKHVSPLFTLTEIPLKCITHTQINTTIQKCLDFYTVFEISLLRLHLLPFLFKCFLSCNLFLWWQIWLLSIIQCHVIFRNHAKILIYCSRNISYSYQKQLCCCNVFEGFFDE